MTSETEVEAMTNLPFALKSPAWLRTISGKTLLACIAVVFLASTMAHAEVPVAVPENNGGRARPDSGLEHWLGLLPTSSPLAIPLLILSLHRSRRTPAADVANLFPAAVGFGRSRCSHAPIWPWPR